MNLLIVDDEDFVLDYLEEIISISTYNFHAVYRANSVDEALRSVHHFSISLIITDIRMPGRSGIELLEAVRVKYPEIKVILLSGYSDFEYAHQAIKQGAADYLLKPVTEEEVIDCLNKVITLIENEKRVQASLSDANSVLKHGLFRMREHLLLDLVLGKRFSLEALQHQTEALLLPIRVNQHCRLALIRMETGLQEASHEDFELLSYAVINMAEEIMYGKIDHPSSLWSCKDANRYVILIIPTDTQEESPYLHRMEKLRQAAQTYLKRPISILLSGPLLLHKELNKLYLHALQAFWQSSGSMTGILLSLENGSEKKEYKPLSLLYQSPSFLQYIESGQWNEATDRAQQIINELNSLPYGTRQHLMEAVYYFVTAFSNMAHKQGDSLADILDNTAPLRNPLYFHSADQLKEWVFQLVDQFRQTLFESSSGRNHVVSQVQKYVSEHYQEDVTLTKISEHVYLHPVYLSRLYKKMTGESLSQYITRFRMEKAASLLSATNKKVCDIAKEVGYFKTQYFIRLFKDYYELTPQSFRSRYESNNNLVE